MQDTEVKMTQEGFLDELSTVEIDCRQGGISLETPWNETSLSSVRSIQTYACGVNPAVSLGS